MSHAIALLAGAAFGVAAMKTTVAEPAWAFLFAAGCVLAVIAAMTHHEEEKRR